MHIGQVIKQIFFCVNNKSAYHPALTVMLRYDKTCFYNMAYMNDTLNVETESDQKQESYTMK